MDINKLFQAAEFECGRVLRVLPEKEIGSPKQYMTKVLEISTLPSLDVLYPRIITISIGDLTPIGTRGNNVGYRIPSNKTEGLEIISVRSLIPKRTDEQTAGIDMNNVATTNNIRMYAYPNRFGRYSSANMYESIVTAQINYADRMAMSQVLESPLPRFEAPNIIWINRSSSGYGSYDVQLCTKNDPNLVTLDDRVFEAVKRLFILDLKAAIYGDYGILSTIETPFGTIDLKIEEWSGARQERQDLYDQYESMSHLRRHSPIFAG